MKTLRNPLIQIVLILISYLSKGQNISGVINTYAVVVNIDTSYACGTRLTVDTSSYFSSGDSVLIIQMKGADVSLYNDISCGTIYNYQSSGNYEIASVQSISGNDITLNETLQRTYNPNGKVQLIRIPVYNNATITNTLSCMPWNGMKGGVLIFFVNNTLTFNDQIDITGKGFRGGTISNNPNGNCANSNNGYALNLNAAWSVGGEKGESIAETTSFNGGGRGRVASGGGGGNKHNTGGGGGGNFTDGGKGGNEMGDCTQNGNGGLGGQGLNYSSVINKIFLGGGGGCGDFNNAVGSTGTSGGGIVIIRANQIVGNNNTIRNNGVDQLIQATGIGDGAGGGGAGGTILLNCPTYSGILNIEANGGHGGDQGPGTYYGCFGPGGGGGCGIVLSNVILPPNVVIQNIPGTHGEILNPIVPCYGTPYGSSNGAVSAVSSLSNFIIPTAHPQSSQALAVNLGNDTTLCAGQIFTLNSGYPNLEKLWSTGDTTTIIAVNNAGQYIVTVKDLPNCIYGTDTITINILNPQTFSIPDQELCENDTINIQSPLTGTSYLWSNTMNTSSIQINQPGKYWLRVINPPCTNFTDTFNVISTSIPDISPIAYKKLCNIGQPITISVNTSSTQGNILWYDGGQQHVKTISTPGEYWVSFTNSCGSDTSYFNIENEGVTSLFIPNSFTPNGDLLNDALNIRASIPDAIRDFYFTIYNRYGEQVFETNSLALSWNGEYHNLPAPVGTYYWYLKGKSNCGDIFLKGDVTLLR